MQLYLLCCLAFFVRAYSSSVHLRGTETEYEEVEVIESSPFVLGEQTYASKADFIFSGKRCATRDYDEIERFSIEEMMMELPEEDDDEDEEHSLRSRSIRVYFHVLTSSSGQGQVSNAVLASQINVLNKAYRGTKFSFSLAGVTRTNNNNWYSAGIHSPFEGQMKKALRQGSYADMNVYTTGQSDNTLGWATLPTSIGNDMSYDGVVIDYRSLPGGTFYPYNLGHTLTHESGHWLGLEHTFTGGCAVSKSGGDQVGDTPAERDANFGCPPKRTNSCPGSTGGLKGNDPIHNYMDYTDDACMDNFTDGQAARAWKMFRLFRNR